MRTLLVLALTAACAQAAVPDPTRPPSAAEIKAWSGHGGGGSATWRLESVLISDSRRVAVINGDRVTVGDRVNGAEVIAIDAGRVTLRTGGGQIELAIHRSWADEKR